MPDPDAPTANTRRVDVRPLEGTWCLQEDGDRAVQRTFDERAKAVAAARSLASEREALLVIYDEGGRIEEQQDYGTMGARPSPESDLTGPGGQRAVEKAGQRSMHRG